MTRLTTTLLLLVASFSACDAAPSYQEDTNGYLRDLATILAETRNDPPLHHCIQRKITTGLYEEATDLHYILALCDQQLGRLR